MKTKGIQKRKNGVVYKKDSDGIPNPKYVDVLDEDKPISGQKFTCLSFISPEKEIKQRESFLFNSYIKEWDMQKSLEKYTQFLNFVAYKYKVDFNQLDKDFVEFCKEENANLFTTTLEEEYKTFLDNNEDKLMETFNEKHSFQTSIRGIKVRGSYPNQHEAELRCKLLREVDPAHDVYVGPVGSWLPFHPEAYKTERIEYMEEELNELMHEKIKNENRANIEFEKRVKESKRKAMEENKKKAIENSNPLSQMLNKNGDLISVANANTTETKLGDNNVAVADIRKELFDGENVIMDFKNNDHGYSELTINKEKKKDTVERRKDTTEEKKDTIKEKKDTIKEKKDTIEEINIILNDTEHKSDCVKQVCKLPGFKKCIHTGNKNEIVCECMIDKKSIGTANDSGANDNGTNDSGANDNGTNDSDANDNSANDNSANDGGANDGGANDGGANDGGANDGGANDNSTTKYE